MLPGKLGSPILADLSLVNIYIRRDSEKKLKDNFVSVLKKISRAASCKYGNYPKENKGKEQVSETEKYTILLKD